MNGVNRNIRRALRWLAFMRAEGVKAHGDMVRHYRSRYYRVIGKTVHIYIPEVSP